jgi:hypothetical protein
MELKSNINQEGNLLIKKDNDNIVLSSKECIDLWRYLNEKHFPNNPKVFIDKNIEGVFL